MMCGKTIRRIAQYKCLYGLVVVVLNVEQHKQETGKVKGIL